MYAVRLPAADLVRRPAAIAKAWEELRGCRGADFGSEPLLGNRAPPLDYRR